MEWFIDLKVPIFLGLTLIVTIIGCFLSLYAFHALTKGHHFREWREFEPLDTPLPKAVRNNDYDACIALIQGRLQIMFPDLYDKYADVMCGGWFIENVALNYFNNINSCGKVSILAKEIMNIKPQMDKFIKLHRSTLSAIDFIKNS